MVTKRRQLKWLAKNRTEFDFDVVIMSTDEVGELADIWDARHYKITREEWQQERDKISYANKSAMIGTQRVPQAILEAYKALEDLPHTGAILEAWGKGAEEFMSESSSKQKVDNSWHEHGEFPPAGYECEVKESDGEWHKTHIVGFDDDGYCVYTTPWNSLARDYDGDGDKYNFRPLRTEREKAVDEMVKAANLQDEYSNYTISNDVIRVISERLYYAGFHK